jgi:hypothetical protein
MAVGVVYILAYAREYQAQRDSIPSSTLQGDVAEVDRVEPVVTSV